MNVAKLKYNYRNLWRKCWKSTEIVGHQWKSRQFMSCFASGVFCCLLPDFKTRPKTHNLYASLPKDAQPICVISERRITIMRHYKTQYFMRFHFKDASVLCVFQ